MAENSATAPQTSNEESFAETKGKGKAAAEQVPGDDAAMDDDDSDSDEEEKNVEPDEDGLEEIDLNNIVPGERRTRGAQIDYAKAAEQTPADDYDEEEDDDFHPPEGEEEEDTQMSG